MTTKVTHIDSVRKAVGMVLNRRVRVKSGYDLRTPLAAKAEDADEFDGWTAFLNNRGTLVHVMRKGCGFMMIRLVVYPLKNASDDYKNSYISKRLYEGLT